MQQKVFLISDTHFSHRNIIRYEYRPFKDTYEMDEYMIGKWNSAVSQNDLVFHLGDVFERYFYKDYLLTHMPIDEIPLKTAIGNGLLKGNIHGHTHSKNQHLNRDFYRCCCVELIAYTPILFNEFVNI